MDVASLIVECIASGNITNTIHDVAKSPRENLATRRIMNENLRTAVLFDYCHFRYIEVEDGFM